MRLGFYDPVSIQAYKQIPTSAINSVSHQALALRAAVEGIVLLKMESGALPFNRAFIQNVAVIGPNGDATTTMLVSFFSYYL
jgi:beta-glucosidase-like glycosyl hydrolase